MPLTQINNTVTDISTLTANNAGYLGGIPAASYPDNSKFASSLSTNGYQKLPGGLIIQWGRVNSPATSATTLTFPIAFPSACATVTVAAVGDNGENMVYIKPNTINTTSFQYTSYGVWASVIVPEQMSWIAIGY